MVRFFSLYYSRVRLFFASQTANYLFYWFNNPKIENKICFLVDEKWKNNVAFFSLSLFLKKLVFVPIEWEEVFFNRLVTKISFFSSDNVFLFNFLLLLFSLLLIFFYVFYFKIEIKMREREKKLFLFFLPTLCLKKIFSLF